MKKCNECGNKEWSDSKFCSVCGKNSFTDISKYCEHCGVMLCNDNKFCSNCGKEIKQPVPATKRKSLIQRFFKAFLGISS